MELIEKLKQKARNLPEMPGVYIMRDKDDKIIYVGKAKSLKDRVYQYFCNTSAHTQKVMAMVRQVNDFEYIICDSEYEALMLEAAQIKQHAPHYNVLLKDDKGYHYIKVTNGDYPRITVEHQMTDDKAEYIGPYYSSYILKNTVDEALKAFGLPRCSREFPRDIGKGRPCLNHHIGLCSAVCSGKISKEQYKEAAAQAVKFIKCGEKESIAELKAKMLQASERLDFENAAKLRDRIKAIEKISTKQKVVASPYKRQDVIGMFYSDGEACFHVFKFIDGKLSDSEDFYINNVIDEQEARTDFFMSYYSLNRDIPKRIITDTSFKDIEILERILSEKAQKSVNIIVPKIGEQYKLVQMCISNACDYLSQRQYKSLHKAAELDELAMLLGLAHPPKIIEAYDISHTAGSDTVGGMTVFKDGTPDKRMYKRFKVANITGNDDYGSMAEVLSRRLDEYIEKKNPSFSVLPDLILVDGGKGQVSAALEVLRTKGIDIPLFGMVKDSSHKTRAICSADGEIQIKPNKKVFKLVTTIQDETHRFAIEYHRKRSAKSKLTSSLCQIDGVGPVRAKKLLEHFRTLSAVSDATVEQLSMAPGMNKTVAQEIFDFFHKNT